MLYRDKRRCPHCQEKISAKAVVCPRCTKDVKPIQALSIAKVSLLAFLGLVIYSAYSNATQQGTTEQQASTIATPAVTQPYSAWVVSEAASRMDDTRGVTLSLDATERVSAWPNQRLTPTLIIRCKEKSTDVYIVNGTAAATVYGEVDAASVRLRLDAEPAFSQLWSESTDGEGVFSRNPISLARRLAKASTLMYEFTPFNSNPATTTFDLTGLGAHLPKVAEACGWKL